MQDVSAQSSLLWDSVTSCAIDHIVREPRGTLPIIHLSQSNQVILTGIED